MSLTHPPPGSRGVASGSSTRTSLKLADVFYFNGLIAQHPEFYMSRGLLAVRSPIFLHILTTLTPGGGRSPHLSFLPRFISLTPRADLAPFSGSNPAQPFAIVDPLPWSRCPPRCTIIRPRKRN